VIEGVFAQISPTQVAQLEVSSTADQAAFARSLLAAWLKRASK
jgi:hypothetical protein